MQKYNDYIVSYHDLFTRRLQGRVNAEDRHGRMTLAKPETKYEIKEIIISQSGSFYSAFPGGVSRTENQRFLSRLFFRRMICKKLVVSSEIVHPWRFRCLRGSENRPRENLDISPRTQQLTSG